jgi:hypothetical protein
MVHLIVEIYLTIISFETGVLGSLEDERIIVLYEFYFFFTPEGEHVDRFYPSMLTAAPAFVLCPMKLLSNQPSYKISSALLKYSSCSAVIDQNLQALEALWLRRCLAF